jgi:hypothetical protein
MKIVAVASVFLLAMFPVSAQQRADTTFQPIVANPAYQPGTGPVVLVDAAHHNFHTLDGRFWAFGEVLERDGYVVRSSDVPFSDAALEEATILVISNALNERNVEDWSLPTPSAFNAEEIEVVRGWVESGGSLWLIADHMPMPGAASELAASFGFEFNNGFAFDTTSRDLTIFRRSDGSLRDHPTTSGRHAGERVDSIRTFTGQAFLAGENAEPLFVLRRPMTSFMPAVAWEFDENTRVVPVHGWYQGAVARVGSGRVAVFGEAAMFTAQWAGQGTGWFGLRSSGAEQNQQFLLNVAHWLSGLISDNP